MRKVLTPAERRKRLTKLRNTVDKRLLEYNAAMWREVVYARAGYKCEKCGKPGSPGVEIDGLHAHHIIKRSQSRNLQYDPENGACLCAGCHSFADRDPIGFMAKHCDEKRVDYLLKIRRSLMRPVVEIETEILLMTLNRMYDQYRTDEITKARERYEAAQAKHAAFKERAA